MIEVSKKIVITLELDFEEARKFRDDLKNGIKITPIASITINDLYDLLTKNVGPGPIRSVNES